MYTIKTSEKQKSESQSPFVDQPALLPKNRFQILTSCLRAVVRGIERQFEPSDELANLNQARPREGAMSNWLTAPLVSTVHPTPLTLTIFK